MSHFTTIKTKIVEREHLLKALKDLGYECEVGELTVRGDFLETAPVEVRLSPKWAQRSIGFRKVGESYACIANWTGVNRPERERFFQDLNQRYAYHTTVAKLEAQGFTLAEEQKAGDGRIHLVLRRMS